MSTKIYNGIKFKTTNYKELLDQLISVKKFAKEIALDMIRDLDLVLFIVANGLKNKSAWDITQKLINAIDFPNIIEWTFIPRLHFSVIIYPTPEGDIYGYYFDSGKAEFKKLLEPYFTDFHYQNQTDIPEGIDPDEWEFRAKKWNELIDYKLKDTGFTFEFITSDDLDIFELESRIEVILEKLNREDKINSLF
jgi:hypothetical protein